MASVSGSDRVISSVELKEELSKLPPQIAFKSGLVGLDTLIGGFAEGDFIIVSGAPKMGKTLACITLTKKFVAQEIPVLWFSVELPYPEFLTMFGDTSPNLYLPRQRNERTVDWIEKKIAEAVEKYQVKVVFIDHLGLIRNEDLAKSFNSIDIMDARLDRLREIALRYKIVLIGTSEHDKESLKRGGATEMKSSGLRGCVVGDTVIDNAITGERKSIKEWNKDWSGLYVNSFSPQGKIERDEVVWLGETGVKGIIEVESESGIVLKVSEEELFWNGIKWQRADSLKKGDGICLAERLPIKKPSKSISEAEAEMLGWLLGDGYFGITPCLTIRGYDWEQTYIEKLALSVGLKVKAREGKEPTYRELSLSPHTSPFRRRLKVWGLDGKRGKDKFVPDEFYRQEDKVIASLLRGLFHTDGCITDGGDKRIEFSNISPHLINSVRYMLLRLGIPSRVSYHKPHIIYNGNYNQESWKVIVSGLNNLVNFQSRVGMILDKKEKLERVLSQLKQGLVHTDKFNTLPSSVMEKVRQSLDGKQYAGISRKERLQLKPLASISRHLVPKYAKHKKLSWLTHISAQELFFDRVKRVSKLPTEVTFDLETKSNHNYFVDGILVHNTARLAYTASTILGIERLSATKKALTWQEMEEEDGVILVPPEDMWIYVLDCRRTGTRKIRIRCHLDENGDIAEYGRGT